MLLRLLRTSFVSRSSSLLLSLHLLPTPPRPRPNTPIRPRPRPRFQSTTPSTVPTDAEPRLQLTFTCTANNCGHRSTHTFTKRSYESGIVLLQCPGCKNRHLLADHIGWFKESTQNGMFKTVEDLLRAKGELVQRGKVYEDGTVEILPPAPEKKESCEKEGSIY